RWTDGRQRFEFAVERAERSGQAVDVPDRLLLSWHSARGQDDASPPVVRAGERWQLPVTLRRPHSLLNPHGFDRERWLWEHGIGASGSVRSGRDDRPVRRLSPADRLSVDGARQAVGERIAVRVTDQRQAGVIAALVVGDQSAILRQDWELFRVTGVAHLMSISGLHVTMFAWLALRVVGAFWRVLARRHPRVALAVPVPVAAAWGGIALATAYAIFAGWGVPAQRTLLMLAVVLGLRLRGHRWPWPVVWLLAMAVVLLLDPLALMQPGFWLSFVAVGILFSSDPGRGLITDEEVGGWRRPARVVGRLLAEQGVITLALAPLTLMLFAQVSLAGLVANLLAVPWVTLVVTPLAFLGVVLPWAWDVAAMALALMALFLEWTAMLPWAVIERPIAPWPLAAAAVTGGILLVQRWPWVLRSAGVLLMWPALAWAPPRPANGEFELMAIDVGQGSAILVRTASRSLLFDTGPRQGEDSNAADRVIVPLLRALGERLDAVVVSHGDSDHAGGMEAIAAAHPQARWLASFAEEPSRRCVAGQHWSWDGVRFEFMHPWPQDYGADGRGRLDDNAMSCVLRITHAEGRESAWLTGDIDAEREVRLSMAHPQARASVLMAPHHGSATSSSPAWLNTLQPRHIIIQAGYRNAFRHPAPTVLARYRQRHMTWVSSPACGAATWRSAEPGQMHCWRQQDRRYWRSTVVEAAGADGQGEEASGQDSDD
ncbi:MAG: DNA internalization-related competence protein ComEC/Rec2, partial [Gammaproteobacteria bacterium]